MTQRSREFASFYSEHRFHDQLAHYRARVAEFEAAHAQASWAAGIVMIAASGAAFVAASGAGPGPIWRILAAALPALSAAIAAYQRLFAFEHFGKLFQDAITALTTLGERPAGETDAELADYVSLVEGVFSREQGQWGQLTAALEAPEIRAPGATRSQP